MGEDEGPRFFEPSYVYAPYIPVRLNFILKP